MSIKKAAMLSMAGKYVVVILNLVITAILARLVTPSEYGIVAIVNVFVSFFTILADFGVGSAVVQNQTLNKEDIQNIFSWSLGRAVLLGVFFVFLAWPIAIFYADNVYLTIVPLLSISVVFSAANMVPNALLLKKKKYKLVAIRMVVVCVICAIITITLAYKGASYYALVVNTISASFLNLAWNMWGSGLRLFTTTEDKEKSIKKVKNFSSYLLKFNVLNYFSRNLDNILVGKFMGAEQLGYYNKAYQLMLYPMNNFTNVITPVLLPFLSDKQDDKEYIYQKYLETVRLLSLLGIYISVFCYFTSYELVGILYGDAWIMTVPCFQLLSISIWSQMICATSGTMFQVLDQTERQFRRGIITAVTTISCILIGIYFNSIMAVSFFVTLAYLSNFITMLFFLVKQSFGKSCVEYLRQFIPDIIILIVVGIVLYLDGLMNFESKYISFIIKLITSGISYIIMLFLTNQHKNILRYLPSKIKSKFDLGGK